MDLFSVFTREKDQVGISIHGDTRALIRIRMGATACYSLTLDQIPQAVAALKRDGFKLEFDGAFYDEKRNCFSSRHPDFENNTYFGFVFCGPDVNEEVQQVERLASPLLTTDLRSTVLTWLRSLDLSSEVFVAPKGNVALALLLSEFARVSGRALYTAIPGAPETMPSSDGESWKRWLETQFDKKQVHDLFDVMNWSKPAFINPATKLLI